MIKPSFFMQRPMVVETVTDPLRASFFVVGDAARGAHAATAAGAQLAAIDGARVARAWVLEQTGKSPPEAAHFYQLGTMSATRGLLRKAMPWFKARPEKFRPVESTASFQHLDLPKLWKNRNDYKAWQGNTLAASARAVLGSHPNSPHVAVAHAL